MTTEQDIRAWLKDAKLMGASHVIVKTDWFDHSDYPIYVMPPDKPREVALRSQDRVMEVYALALDIEQQLHEHRAFHWD